MNVEITDPVFTCLEKDHYYNLCGLINSDHEIAQCAFNRGMIFRLSLRLGIQNLYSQSIVEIYCTNRTMMPKTPPNFSKTIQIAFMKNCLYVGEKKIDGIAFQNFKIIIDNPEERFIWLSSPRADFWTNPNHPESNSLEPILESASGSVFGRAVKPEQRRIFLSQGIGGVKWENWRLEAEELKKELRRPETDFISDGKLMFESSFDSPPMHM